MRNMTIFSVILLVICGVAVADGKFFYVPDDHAPEIPYQRALILYIDGVETLILQSKYTVSESVDGKPLGWVVPVPEKPELASIPAVSAQSLFSDLASDSCPRVFILSYIIGVCFFPVICIICIICILRLLCYVMAFIIGKKFPSSGWILAVLSSILLWVIYILFIHLHLFTLASLVLEVDVLHEENVGVYNIKVIQSDSSEALVAWLNDGGFYFEEKDVKVFDDYVKKGWCFVVAQLAADAGTNPDEIQYQGLAAPLILRFQCEKPVYPLTLTGTGGYATEILIYLAAEKYMTCDDNRLEMKYAGEFRHWNNRYDEAHYSPFKSCDPEGFIQIGVAPKLHLIKYKGLLTPDQMNTDLTFTSTDEDISYREHIIVWSEEDLQ